MIKSLSSIIHAKGEGLQNRFWSKVNKTETCWNWTAGRDSAGYGMFSLFGHGAAPAKAHRVSFIMHNGEVPAGKEVCHACDNPACVNPNHLFAATHQDNMLDAKRKGRMKIASKGRPGARNPAAKLTESAAREIIKLRLCGVTQTEAGKRFGVSRSCVSLIERGKKWKGLV